MNLEECPLSYECEKCRDGDEKSGIYNCDFCHRFFCEPCAPRKPYFTAHCFLCGSPGLYFCSMRCRFGISQQTLNVRATWRCGCCEELLFEGYRVLKGEQEGAQDFVRQFWDSIMLKPQK